MIEYALIYIAIGAVVAGLSWAFEPTRPRDVMTRGWTVLVFLSWPVWIAMLAYILARPR